MNEDLIFLLRMYEVINNGDKLKAVEDMEGYVTGNLYIMSPPQFLNVKKIPKSERDKTYEEFAGMKEEVCFSLQWTDGSSTRDHGVFRTKEQAMDSINVWWELNKFKPKYVRTWDKNGVTTVDYGFHDMFYHIKEISYSNFGERMAFGGINIGK
ncbi:hypothetical protein [Vagococcus fluvialis]|uniref:hypothetical protein n=1 Tax=Vagococcus fluvialis TaxID=2738 RepID=UPI001D0A6851|nr:hypothetical protein [Vagococcus fluvialis]